MKPADYSYLVLMPLLLSVGQVLFKKTADGVAAHSLPRFLGSLLGSPHFRGTLCVCGAASAPSPLIEGEKLAEADAFFKQHQVASHGASPFLSESYEAGDTLDTKVIENYCGGSIARRPGRQF